MIRFVNSDGVGHNTQILNADTGEDLTKVLSIAYGGKITVDRVVTAELSLVFMAVDLTAAQTKWLTKHPITGDYVDLGAMEFRDGTRVEFAEDGTPRIVAGEPKSNQDTAAA